MELDTFLLVVVLLGTIDTIFLGACAYFLLGIRNSKTAPSFSVNPAASLPRPSSSEERVSARAAPAPAPEAVAPPAPEQAPSSPLTGERPAEEHTPAPSPDLPFSPPAAETRTDLPGVSPVSVFWEYTEDGFIPVNPNLTGRRTAPASTHPSSLQHEDPAGEAWL